MGRYKYVNNKQHGFAHVRVTDREFTVHILGINQQTQETTELYKVSVFNKNLGSFLGEEASQ
jgi:hypothetical protein